MGIEIATKKNRWASKCSLLCVLHMRNDLVPFVAELNRFGFRFDKMTIIGVPYSSKGPARDELSRQGVYAIMPTWDTLDIQVRTELMRTIQKCNDDHSQFYIIEDGGYIVPIIHTNEYTVGIPCCSGAVEQTAQGVWRDTQVKKLEIPVWTLTDSYLKRRVEPPAVAAAICRSLEIILQEVDLGLTGKTISVFGFGAIGENVANALRSRGNEVRVYDVDPNHMVSAKLQGYTTGTKFDSVSSSDIILGCSGSQSISLPVFSRVKTGTIFASCSSKRIEIDTRNLELISSSVKGLTEHIKEYGLPGKRFVRLANEGFPINFITETSLPLEVMDLIYSEMFVCLQHLRRYGSTEIHQLDDNQTMRISKYWLKTHDRK